MIYEIFQSLAATILVAVLTSSCGGSPTQPSAVNLQGTWGRGSAAQGTFSPDVMRGQRNVRYGACRLASL